MITLQIEDYCHNCNEFEANVEKFWHNAFDDDSIIDTIVRCEHAHRCKNFYEKLLRSVEK